MSAIQSFSNRHRRRSRQAFLTSVIYLLVFSASLISLAQEIASPTHEVARDPRYPAHWWTPVAKEGAPSWEIFPQEAGPGEVILSKRNELGLLSNFAATPFVFRAKRYASLEGFWQAMKYPEGQSDARATFPGLEWKFTREEVGNLTSFAAKDAGTLADQNMKKMGITWVTFAGKRFEYRPNVAGQHYRLIVAATRAKVDQNPEVKKVLLATGNLILKPDHHQEPNAPAAWRYFEILTHIRSELQRHRKLRSGLGGGRRGAELLRVCPCTVPTSSKETRFPVVGQFQPRRLGTLMTI